MAIFDDANGCRVVLFKGDGLIHFYSGKTTVGGIPLCGFSPLSKPIPRGLSPEEEAAYLRKHEPDAADAKDMVRIVFYDGEALMMFARAVQDLVITSALQNVVSGMMLDLPQQENDK